MPDSPLKRARLMMSDQVKDESWEVFLKKRINDLYLIFSILPYEYILNLFK